MPHNLAYDVSIGDLVGLVKRLSDGSWAGAGPAVAGGGSSGVLKIPKDAVREVLVHIVADK